MVPNKNRYIIDTRKVEIDIDEKKSDFSVLLLLDLMKPDVYEQHVYPNNIEKVIFFYVENILIFIIKVAICATF